MRLYLVFGLLIAGLSPTFGQLQYPFPYVDLGKAQILIDTMTKENESLKKEREQLGQKIEALRAQILASQQGASVLVPLLEDVKARNADLATLLDSLVDRGLRTQAQAALDKNHATEKRLTQRIDELGVSTIDWGKQMQQLVDQASIDDARLKRNTEDIIVLQATVAKTKAQQDRLLVVIDQVDTLSSKADGALK